MGDEWIGDLELSKSKIFILKRLKEALTKK
jgi:hypothetical protein